MDRTDKILNIIRASVRPFITVSGWSMFLFLVYEIVTWLIDKLSDVTIEPNLVVPILVGIITSFTAAITAIVAFWIGGRQATKPQ